MSGDYTRFEHALKDMEAGRFAWQEAFDDEPLQFIILNGPDYYTVGRVSTDKVAELVCSAVNYMLELHKLIQGGNQRS